MGDYRFVTAWHVEAPIERVWDALVHSEHWPTWWRGVKTVREIEPGDDDGLGNVREYTCKSELPYGLVFRITSTRIDKPHHLEGAATGHLEGTGRWLLAEAGNGTDIQYTWEVRTTQRWMNFLGPVARPLFIRNHHAIMRWGGDGLGRLLGAPLVHVSRREGRAEIGPG